MRLIVSLQTSFRAKTSTAAYRSSFYTHYDHALTVLESRGALSAAPVRRLFIRSRSMLANSRMLLGRTYLLSRYASTRAMLQIAPTLDRFQSMYDIIRGKSSRRKLPAA